MKYLPLIWAALRRKPIRTFVTFLSVTVAFTLFGLMIGLDATMNSLAERAHADRIWSLARFQTTGLPFALGRQVANLPGIKRDAVMNFIAGYVADPKNRAFVLFVDDEYGNIFPDQIPPAMAALLRQDPASVVMNRAMAGLLHLRLGDRFSITDAQHPRADGSHNWPFTVAGIYDDIAQFPGPFIAGNYTYFDKSLPSAQQGKISEVDSQVLDPALAPALAEKIDALYANSGSPTRSQTEKQIYSADFGGVDARALTRKIAAIGLFMILLLTANVIAQSVRERLAEFATLRTIGFSNARLLSLVVAEAAIPCLLGAGAGIALAAWLARHISAILPPGDGVPAPTMTLTVILLALAAAALLTLFSTLLPIVRLRRLDIAAVLSGHA